MISTLSLRWGSLRTSVSSLVPSPVCQNVTGFDANMLYLSYLIQDMLTSWYMKDTAENNFKPETWAEKWLGRRQIPIDGWYKKTYIYKGIMRRQNNLNKKHYMDVQETQNNWHGKYGGFRASTWSGWLPLLESAWLPLRCEDLTPLVNRWRPSTSIEQMYSHNQSCL